MRTADGRLRIDEEFCEELAAAKPMLLDAIGHMRRVVLEDKHCAIALHYRAAPERGREVLELAELAVARLGPDFGVLVGKCVVELRPRHLTKGAALERLMQGEPFRGRTPIFAGDDTTDEDAFDVVNRLGGISVRVGNGTPTAATCRLSDPEQLRRWLLTIAEP